MLSVRPWPPRRKVIAQTTRNRYGRNVPHPVFPSLAEALSWASLPRPTGLWPAVGAGEDGQAAHDVLIAPVISTALSRYGFSTNLTRPSRRMVVDRRVPAALGAHDAGRSTALPRRFAHGCGCAWTRRGDLSGGPAAQPPRGAVAERRRTQVPGGQRSIPAGSQRPDNGGTTIGCPAQPLSARSSRTRQGCGGPGGVRPKAGRNPAAAR